MGPQLTQILEWSLFLTNGVLGLQSCAKRKVLSKEMRSVIALHHCELSTTEAHSHVISHTLSDGATIINREPCREFHRLLKV
ncbi:hypothetical protein DY000_02038836 [Brassica cretica]|uniref:Secreted protein n=1 Tax=Brassica cretica TaxID=69181 RepID=A0ABQ7BIS2_BRACR|nr:hypothetical protein DY000_02038836 [Brassica cretica]